MIPAWWRKALRRLLVAAHVVTGCTQAPSSDSGVAVSPVLAAEAPFVIRAFHPWNDGRWIGNAIAYGPFRDGQSPSGAAPHRGELREDLEILSRHWKLLRVYGAGGPTEEILEVIRADALDMRVMLGIWIAPEEPPDGPESANRREMDTALRLSAAYPDVVTAISVGNETQVFWSAHRVDVQRLIGLVREVRARTSMPVTVADDFNFWNKPESRLLAREVDFIVTHIHPLWNGRQLDDAVEWTRTLLAEVQAVHPDRKIVLGETGWATAKHNEGEQHRLIRGRVGEEEQRIFYEALRRWATQQRVPTFFFEAFDEKWKGGPHPDEVEKHWGLFRSDRSPKKAMVEWVR